MDRCETLRRSGLVFLKVNSSIRRNIGWVRKKEVIGGGESGFSAMVHGTKKIYTWFIHTRQSGIQPVSLHVRAARASLVCILQSDKFRLPFLFFLPFYLHSLLQMPLIARRLSCSCLQLAVFVYAVLAILFLTSKRLGYQLPWNSSSSESLFMQHHRQQQRKQIPDTHAQSPYFAKQPDTYSTGPRYNPNQFTVTLPQPGNHTARVNAGFIVLVRNSELYGMLQSMYDVGKCEN